MDNTIETGSKVKLKTGSPVMVVERISEDGLVAYCSWCGDNSTKFKQVAFLKSALMPEGDVA